jgi:hypothetical protein
MKPIAICCLLLASFLVAGNGVGKENLPAGHLTHFDNLNKFGGGYSLDVFDDKKIHAALKKLLGKYLSQFKDNLSVSDGIAINTAGALETSGCAQHLCTIEDATLYMHASGEIYAAIHTDKKVLYFTTDAEYKAKPIDPIVRFMKDFPEAQLVLMSK